MFRHGMLPAVYSQRAAAKRGIGWRRAGYGVQYFRPCPESDFGFRHHCLSFSYRFKSSNDCVYFAYAVPYAYTELQCYLRRLDRLCASQAARLHFRREQLCETLAGNSCDLLTITAPGDKAELADRPVIFLSARVHPGETHASWIMEGCLEFLTSDCAEATALRSQLVFKIVPMLNPDGVINGNTRASLAGVDLNRNWHAPSQLQHPTIYCTKELLRGFSASHRLLLFCDMHGPGRAACAPRSGSPLSRRGAGLTGPRRLAHPHRVAALAP